LIRLFRFAGNGTIAPLHGYIVNPGMECSHFTASIHSGWVQARPASLETLKCAIRETKDDFKKNIDGRRSNNNQLAGTIFGALAGGLIGGAASRGNGGAVAGGAILGGLLGNVISRDIDCDDQPYAFQVYASGLNGPVGQRSEWRNRDNYGYFTPTREFRRGTVVCREFTETTYRRGRQAITRTGTACREVGGHWRFD
jgi:surface antigen